MGRSFRRRWARPHRGLRPAAHDDRFALYGDEFMERDSRHAANSMLDEDGGLYRTAQRGTHTRPVRLGRVSTMRQTIAVSSAMLRIEGERM